MPLPCQFRDMRAREKLKFCRAGVAGGNCVVLKVGRAWGTKRLEHEAMSHPQISKGWRGDYQGGLRQDARTYGARASIKPFRIPLDLFNDSSDLECYLRKIFIFTVLPFSILKAASLNLAGPNSPRALLEKP